MKKVLKIIYYFVFLFLWILYIILIGIVLSYIFDLIKMPDSMYFLKQLILVIVVFLLAKPIVYPCMDWIAMKFGLTVEDFKKNSK